ncbi:MAG: tetratricopeptide repeat protein [Cyanobacteria bacterium HKST-UBA02]|nr:tetratricopeptide repeat protein [Cyanobacteria bacterium HKST-UBA02]
MMAGVYASTNVPPAMETHRESGREFLSKLDSICQESASRTSMAALTILQTRFQSGLAEGEKLFVSINLSDTSASIEPVFVRVESWSDNHLRGYLASDALIRSGFRSGDQISFNSEDVIDWSIVRNAGELFDSSSPGPDGAPDLVPARKIRPGEKKELLKLVIAALSRIKTDPSDTRSYVELAWAHNRLGDTDKALTYCNLAIAMKPEQLQAYRQRASASMSRGDDRQALIDLEKALELDPQNGAYHCTRGWIFARLGDFDQAVEESTRSISLQPDYAPAYYCRGKAHAHKRNYLAAIDDLSRAIELLPGGHASYFLWRGFAHTCLTDQEKAREDLLKAVNLEPYNFMARLFAGIAEFSCGNARQALLHLNRAVRLCPESVEAYCGRGLVYMQLRDYRRAVRDFDTAIVLDQGSFPAYKYRGAAYSLMGRNKNAAADLVRALSIKPGSRFCLSRLAGLQMKEGMYEECIASYNDLLSLDPRDGSAYSARGRAYGALGMPGKEMEDRYNAIAVDPANMYTYLVN